MLYLRVDIHYALGLAAQAVRATVYTDLLVQLILKLIDNGPENLDVTYLLDVGLAMSIVHD